MSEIREILIAIAFCVWVFFLLLVISLLPFLILQVMQRVVCIPLWISIPLNIILGLWCFVSSYFMMTTLTPWGGDK